MKIPSAILCAILALCFTACSSLRKPADEIATRLISETPAGTSRAKVESHIAQSEWHRLSENTLASAKAAPQPTESFITAKIGRYLTWEHVIPLRTHVFATWIFSADDRLTRIHIYKETTGP